MAEPKILRELLGLLGRSEIPVEVRSVVADELGKHRYLPAKDLLMQGLTDANANMRSACIRALGIEMEVREAAPLLVEILLHDEFEHVQIDAAYGLGALRYKPALAALKEATLDESRDMTTRGAAYEAILSILDRESDEIPDFGAPTVIDWDFVRDL